MKHRFSIWPLVALGGLASVFTVGAAPAWEAPPAQQKQGQFWRWNWYERGLTNGNPACETRFRVNAPAISLHPTFGRRVEPRENGMRLIKAEEDLFMLTAAEFYCEGWGGHPGTVKEYFTLNGVHDPVAEGSRHELIYSGLPVDPKTLRRGLNRIVLLSDIEHHGIEVIYPGPALVVRHRTEGDR
jgi:hypothetical protein